MPVYHGSGCCLAGKKKAHSRQPGNTSVTETDANLELNNVSYSTLGSDNFRLWELNARTARVFDEGKKIILDDLQITFYQRNGTPYQLKADQGELDMETRNISISGNVRAVLPDNATIETQSAFYDNTSRIITSSRSAYHNPWFLNHAGRRNECRSKH